MLPESCDMFTTYELKLEFFMQIVRDRDGAEKEPSTVVILALGAPRQEYHELDASLDYTAKFCLFLKLMKCI